jgi:hypothetical protein
VEALEGRIMPMHDWTRVSAGTHHDFHCSWLPELKNRLNQGLLPADHYAQVEQVMEAVTADLLTLQTEALPEAHVEEGEGGLAGAVAPPQVQFTDSLEADIYAGRARQIVIRHSGDDRIVALIELVSPGNKAGEYPFRTFLDKTIAALLQGYHLLLIDPFPPTRRDPGGIHKALWSELGGQFDPPADKPLTLAAYAAGVVRNTAYVQPIAVGDRLTSMPLFLTPDRYVPVPLEESYMATFQGVPRRWRRTLEQPAVG